MTHGLQLSMIGKKRPVEKYDASELSRSLSEGRGTYLEALGQTNGTTTPRMFSNDKRRAMWYQWKLTRHLLGNLTTRNGLPRMTNLKTKDDASNARNKAT